MINLPPEQFGTVPHCNFSLLPVKPLFLLGAIACRLPTNFFMILRSFVDCLLRKLTEDYQQHKDPGVRHNLNCQYDVILESSLKQQQQKKT